MWVRVPPGVKLDEKYPVFFWSYSVGVITLGFDSSDMGSNPIGTSHAFVAQSVERRTFNPVVAGSSPAESKFFLLPISGFLTHFWVALFC